VREIWQTGRCGEPGCAVVRVYSDLRRNQVLSGAARPGYMFCGAVFAVYVYSAGKAIGRLQRHHVIAKQSRQASRESLSRLQYR